MSTEALATTTDVVSSPARRNASSIDRHASSAVAYFSLALGAAEVAAPAAINRLIGANVDPKIIQLFGGREVLIGLGILASRQPASWLWARVAGDICDLA